MNKRLQEYILSHRALLRIKIPILRRWLRLYWRIHFGSINYALKLHISLMIQHANNICIICLISPCGLPKPRIKVLNFNWHKHRIEYPESKHFVELRSYIDSVLCFLMDAFDLLFLHDGAQVTPFLQMEVYIVLICQIVSIFFILVLHFEHIAFFYQANSLDFGLYVGSYILELIFYVLYLLQL